MLELVSNPTSDNKAQCSTGKPGNVIAVDVAVSKAMRAVEPITETELLPLLAASGRIAGEMRESPINVPPFANSAMDGYALAINSLKGSGPWRLPITHRVVAGCNEEVALKLGEAARIMTGAPLPDGADAVIMQECCERADNEVLINEIPKLRKNIRLIGEDVEVGQELIAKGQLVSQRDLALLAATGISEVRVFRKLRVGLISTGNELRDPGADLKPGQIFNSNRVYLNACLDKKWIELVDYGIVEDNGAAIQNLVRKAADECDVVMTTGGVSAGEEDHMLDVLRRESAQLEVLKVAMRPGKPVTVGRLGSALYLGLPGNPYACAITFIQIAWPALCASANRKADKSQCEGVSSFSYEKKLGRTEYVPVTWDDSDKFARPLVKKLGQGASASLLPFANAKAIAVLRPDVTSISKSNILQLLPVEVI